MIILRVLVIISLIAATAQHVRAQGSASTPAQRARPFAMPDSVSLERLAGYWGGPAYHVIVRKDGHITVRPDSVARQLFRPIPTRVDGARDVMSITGAAMLSELPDTLASHAVFGRVCGTDAPTAIITIYAAGGIKRIIDYQGCLWAPVALRDLERMIDSVANRRPVR
jgi:hypothetical protein